MTSSRRLPSRDVLLADIIEKRQAELEACAQDPWRYIFDHVSTKDEHDATHPVKLFPRKPYIEKLIEIFHEGEDVEFIIKSRQLMVTWVACAYASFHCRFIPHRLCFLQSKKEEDAANLVFNKNPSIGRLSFIETHLPQWMRLNIDWSYGMGIYPNGSKAWAIPQGPQHYEGYVPSLVINDEASLQERWMEGHSALKPCIDGGARCVTIATVRTPSDYSEEMSTFNPDDHENVEVLQHGFWKFRSKSGASAHAIHYTADKAKDPDRDGSEWYERAVSGYIGGSDSHLWKQHMEIDFEATASTRLIPWWKQYRSQFIQEPPPLGKQFGWSYYSGFDYGKRNCSVWLVCAVDPQGNRWIVDEVGGPGEKLGGIPGISQRMQESEYWDQVKHRIYADPSMWNENQAAGESYTSIARLFKQYGVNFKKAPIKGKQADSIGMERLLYDYWPDPAEPKLFISPRCKVTVRQWPTLRYKEWSAVAMKDREIPEELVDKNNDSWKAWVYCEARRPPPRKRISGPPPGSFMAVRRRAIAANYEHTPPNKRRGNLRNPRHIQS
jgi:hypothetical protein